MLHLVRCARLALLLAFVLAPVAAAQGALDGQWVKLKVKAKGFTLDAGGVATKAKYATTVYMFLQADGGLYDYSITYESAPGVWSSTLISSFSPAGENDDIVRDHALAVPGLDGVELNFRSTFRFNIKLDDQQAFKKATVKSDSGHVTAGTLDGTNEFWGTVSFTGSTIDPDKLPFPVKA
jgi:hypothetical protein